MSYLVCCLLYGVAVHVAWCTMPTTLWCACASCLVYYAYYSMVLLRAVTKTRTGLELGLVLLWSSLSFAFAFDNRTTNLLSKGLVELCILVPRSPTQVVASNLIHE